MAVSEHYQIDSSTGELMFINKAERLVSEQIVIVITTMYGNTAWRQATEPI